VLPFGKQEEYQQIADDLGRVIVERDTRGTEGNVKRGLEKLAPIVLRPSTTATTIKKSLKVTDGGFNTLFKKFVGHPLAEYIDSVRVLVAMWFLFNTPEISEEDVAFLVGYTSEKAFANRYKTFTKRTPAEDCLAVRAAAAILERLDTELDTAELSPEERRGMRLLAREVRRRGGRMKTDEPGVGTTASVLAVQPLAVHFHGGQEERDRVERTWQELLGKSREIQTATWRHRIFGLGMGFEVLLEHARREGRQERRRGVEVMQLALLSLEASREDLAEKYRAKHARGIAWRGNLKRLALDLVGAREDLEQAASTAKNDPWTREHPAEAEILWLLGTLLITDCDYPAAERELKRSLRISKTFGDVRGQVRALNKLATAAMYDGRLRQAKAYLEEALELLEERDDAGQRPIVLLTLANVEARRNRFAEAREVLGNLRPFTGPLLENRGMQVLVGWVEAFVTDGEGDKAAAEEGYRRAVQGYEELDEPLLEARARLDLAILLEDQGRSEEAVREAAVLLGVFRAFHIRPETFECLRLLGVSLTRAADRAAALRDLRDALRADPLVEVACPIRRHARG
jgi:tetratricopeptide (TPR) repeat protein/AraC-like DNA-binding protein